MSFYFYIKALNLHPSTISLFVEAPSSLRFFAEPSTVKEGETVKVESITHEVYPPDDVTFRIFSGDQTLHHVTPPDTLTAPNDDGTYNVSAQVDVTALRQFNYQPTPLTCEVDYLGRNRAAKPSQTLTLNVDCRWHCLNSQALAGILI